MRLISILFLLILRGYNSGLRLIGYFSEAFYERFARSLGASSIGYRWIAFLNTDRIDMIAMREEEW